MHGIRLGHTAVHMPFDEGWFRGTIVSFHRPWFHVVFGDGDECDKTGHEIAPFILYEDAHFYDPRFWSPSFDAIHPGDIPGWKRNMLEYLDGFSAFTPGAWYGTDAAVGTAGASLEYDDTVSVEEARRREREVYGAAHREHVGAARAPKTVMDRRNPALRMLWHFAAMGCVLPPTGNDATIYLSKLAVERDNVGAVQSAKTAWSYVCSINNWNKKEYESIQVGAALEAKRREHRRMTKKSAALSADVMRRIINVYGRPRTVRAANEQWELAIATAIGVGFKLLLRYDDLSRCQWGEGYCEVFPTHIRFYLDGRKNNQYGGAFLDIARPEDPGVFGIYHLVLARLEFASEGFVLPHISSSGKVDNSRKMGYKSFVQHLRAALCSIGMTEAEASAYSAHCMRAGGATEAAISGLSPADIAHLAGVADLNWLAYYNRNYLGERLRVSRSLGL